MELVYWGLLLAESELTTIPHLREETRYRKISVGHNEGINTYDDVQQGINSGKYFEWSAGSYVSENKNAGNIYLTFHSGN